MRKSTFAIRLSTVSLGAVVGGAGEIAYADSPRITQRVSGAGTVRRAED